MEEIRTAAFAFYDGGPPELKASGLEFFTSMDEDGNGSISHMEFAKFLDRNRYTYNSRLFKELDADGNGVLDFWEVMVFFYIVQTRKVECCVCETFIRGTYFTCTECLLKPERGYELCCTCYSNRKFNGHGPFLDNYSILPTVRRIMKQQRATGSSPPPDAGTSSGGQQSQALILQSQQQVPHQAQTATYYAPSNMNQPQVGQRRQDNNMQIIVMGDQDSKFRRFLGMLEGATSVGSLISSIASIGLTIGNACSIM